MDTLLKSINSNPNLINLGYVHNVPLIHFTQHPDAIREEGFIHGAPLEYINDTYGTKSIPNGYVFAFLLSGICGSRGCYDYEVPYKGLHLMRRGGAIIFKGSGLYTHHKADSFNQVILTSSTIQDLRSAVVLKNSHSDHWIAKGRLHPDSESDSTFTPVFGRTNLHGAIKYASDHLFGRPFVEESLSLRLK